MGHTPDQRPLPSPSSPLEIRTLELLSGDLANNCGPQSFLQTLLRCLSISTPSLLHPCLTSALQHVGCDWCEGQEKVTPCLQVRRRSPGRCVSAARRDQGSPGLVLGILRGLPAWVRRVGLRNKWGLVVAGGGVPPWAWPSFW